MRASQVCRAFAAVLQTAALSALLVTSRSFAQWIPLASGTTERLNDIAIIDSTIAIVVGNNGTILKTTNSGASWIVKPVGTIHDLRSTAFHLGTGYAVGNGVVCFSSNRGETWSVDSSTHRFTVVEYGPDINPDVYMGDESGVIRFQTVPGGPWQERLLLGGSVVSIGLRYAMETTFVTAATVFGYVYSGPPWDSVWIPILSVWDQLTAGDLGGNVQYLVGWGGNPGPLPLLFHHNLVGNTVWQKSPLPAPYEPYDVKTSANGAVAYVCGSRRAIYRSVDSGATWILQYGSTGYHYPALRAMAFYSEKVGYAVGDSGIILFTSNGGVTSVDEAIELPHMYVLQQNYPNPLNAGTVITFKLPASGFVTLKVYSLLGQEVSTLVSETRLAGEHKVWFDAANLASGVYLYRLSTQGFVHTKKFILLR